MRAAPRSCAVDSVEPNGRTVCTIGSGSTANFADPTDNCGSSCCYRWSLGPPDAVERRCRFRRRVWRRRPVELLATAPENLSEALARTDRVLLVPSAHLLRPSEVRQLAEVLRNLARRPDLEVICAMPVDRASSSGLAPQFGTLGALIPAR